METVLLFQYKNNVIIMQVPVYNLDNKEVGVVEVPDAIFSVKWNRDLVHQVLVAQQANSRDPIAHAKDRSEVRGGGKKPWRQKGTGRSRHGSIRSPLWAGGGVTFGPRNERVFAKKINNKMRRAAVLSVLSKKFSENQIKIVEGFSAPEKATSKAFLALASRVFTQGVATLFVFASGARGWSRGVGNIQKVSCVGPASLNVKDLLRPSSIIIDKNALDEIINRFSTV